MTLTRADVTATISAQMQSLGVTFKELSTIMGKSPAWSASALLGQSQMTSEQATAVGAKLELSDEMVALLQVPAMRGSLDEKVPADPLIYRFHEIMQVYGTTLKALIHEEFGDGIMSAIDFTIDVNRVEDPKGDRVEIVMNGKFLPYKTW